MQAEHEHSPLNDDEPDQSRFSPVLGENVRRMRSYSNITKTRLALMVSIGRPLLNRIEDGTADGYPSSRNWRIPLPRHRASCWRSTAMRTSATKSPIGKQAPPSLRCDTRAFTKSGHLFFAAPRTRSRNPARCPQYPPSNPPGRTCARARTVDEPRRSPRTSWHRRWR